MADENLNEMDDYEAGFYDGEHDSDYVKLLEAYIKHLTGLNVRYNKDDLKKIEDIMFSPEKENDRLFNVGV